MALNIKSMYNNKMNYKKAKIISPEAVRPAVRYSNYLEVTPGTSWGPRIIPDFELILTVSGKYSYLKCDTGEKTEIGEGNVICIPPGEKHVFKCESAYYNRPVIACIHLELSEGSFLAGEYRLSDFPPLVTDTRGDTAIHELFRNCRNTFEGFGKYRREILSTTASELWLRLAEYREGTGERTLSPRIRQMTMFLEKNIAAFPTRHDLAKKFSITPEHVNAMFKKELGLSPSKFLTRIKIYQACRLLREDGLSIKETAHRLCFYDEFHFSKTFKRVMGVSPSKFKGKTA